MPNVGPYRFWGKTPPPARSRTPEQKIHAEVVPNSTSGGTASMRLYDPIDSFGGAWGVSAKEFTAALDGLDDKVSEIRLHINSPGGEVFDAIAIANALRNHKARVVAVVDGIAASSASFIAASADELIAARNSQMMVHDAMGLAVGNAKVMADMAAVLNKISDNIASFYAEKTGDTTADWRTIMLAETWYTAEEAVEAGLADRVEANAADGGVDAVTNRFDLSIFNYAGRENAPAPAAPHEPPAASAGGSSTTTEGGSAVAFSDEQITELRRKLGVAEDADEATILAAFSEALDERAEPPATPSAPAQPTAQTPTAPVTPEPEAAPAGSSSATPGTMVIDTSAWEEREARIKRLEATDAKRRREERDQVIANAVAEGKFPHARKDHWVRLWDADPEGTRQVIAGLQKDVVPVNELGHASDDESIDDEFSHLFPPSYTTKGA